MNQRWYNDEPPTEGRGRSAKKRAAEAVEELAKRLVALPEAACRKLPLSADLRKELQVARDTEAMGARKRQVKHFAGEMRRREEEIEAIQTFLDGADQVNLQARREFHHLEELRDRLCEPATFAEALDEAMQACPSLDRETLSGLARSVHSSADKRAAREIFRRLRDGAVKI
jgi:ribosome-associated protein